MGHVCDRGSVLFPSTEWQSKNSGSPHCKLPLLSAKPTSGQQKPSHTAPGTSLVLDELHLLLWIGDVLLRNLILHADSLDHKTYMASGRQTDNHIQSLELLIKQCGVPFSVAPVHNNILLLPTPMRIYLSGRERKQEASLWTVHLDSTDKERQTQSSQEPPNLSLRTPPLS